MSGLTTLALREQSAYQRDEIDSLKARVRLLETQELPFVSRLRIDAKGDLFAGTADNAYARLPVGSNGDLLIADSTQTTGLRWGAATAAVISDFAEAAQDAVGAALLDSATIDFTYNDGAGTITAIVIDDSISNAKLRNSVALSVIGRSANSTGDPGDISATAGSGAVLREAGGTLGFGQVATAGIADAAIINAKLANMTQATVKGRPAGAGTGGPTDLSAAQIAAIVEAAITHNNLGGLTTGDPHTQYVLLAGRSGGQTLNGGTGSGNTLILKGTSHATPGPILLNPDGGNVGAGTNDPSATLHVLRNAFPPFRTERTTTITTGSLSCADFIATTSGDMADAFGVQNTFSIRDNAGVLNILGAIGMVRAGADNTGDIVFVPRAAGSANERMRITSSGAVGIGANDPGAALDVAGSARVRGASSDATFTSPGHIAVKDSGGNPFFSYHGDGGGRVGYLQWRINDHARLWQEQNFPLVFGTNGNERMRIGNDGNVGIATTGPQVLLHVGAGTDAPDTSNVNIYATNAGTTAIAARNSTGNIEVFMQAGASSALIGTITNHPLFLRTNNTNHVFLQVDGTMGIRTSSPSATLSIKAGESTDHANVGGIIHVNTTAAGNVGSGEQDLMTFSVPANTLAVNGDSIWFEISAHIASSLSTSKIIRIRFGNSGTNLVHTTNDINSTTTGHVVIRGRIVRTGSSSQISYANNNARANAVNPYFTTIETGLNQTLSSTVTFRVTGQATNNDDIIIQSLVIGWDPVNT